MASMTTSRLPSGKIGRAANSFVVPALAGFRAVFPPEGGTTNRESSLTTPLFDGIL